MKQVWVFRIVHQDTGKPAQGVPVTVLEPSGNAAGYWVSETDGTVAIPRRELIVFRGPSPDGYTDVQTYGESGSVAPLAAPDSDVRVADLLP